MIKVNRDKIVCIYLIVSIFILLFLEIESAGSVPLKVFYIVYNKGYALLWVTVISVLAILLLPGNRKMDVTLSFLIIKAILDLIPYLRDRNIGTSTYWYMFAMVIEMPLVYYIFKQYSGRISSIINVFTIMGLILILQIIFTIISNEYSFSSSAYKHYLRIPIAHSNIIGVILLTILILRFRTNIRNKFHIFINIFFVIGLILTQSRGSWMFLIGWSLLVWMKKLYENNKKVRFLLLILGIIIALFVFILSPALQQILLSTTLSEKFDIFKLSSGRTEIWGLAIQQWLKNPWFGSGLKVISYDITGETILTGVHNIVLDYAVQSGIIGVIVYAIAVFGGLRKHRYRVSSLEVRALLLAAIVMLVYSMVEVCYYNFSCLFLLWGIIGLYNSESVEVQVCNIS